MRNKNIYSKKYITNYAKSRRRLQTPGEIMLWSKLRNRQFHNIKFRRQVPIDIFIIDFYSEELNLIIEIDGLSHDEHRYESDVRREIYFRDLGFNILRFTEYEAVTNIYEVLQSILNYIDS